MQFKLLIENRKTGAKNYYIVEGADMQDALTRAADLFAEGTPNKIIGIEVDTMGTQVVTTYTDGHDTCGNPRNIQIVMRCRQNRADMVSLTRFSYRSPDLPSGSYYNGQYVLARKEFNALVKLAKSQGLYHETN